MRVDRIELRNYGRHRHTVLEPGSARLVVIQGPNAVGKTTLASESIGHAFFKDGRGTVNGGVRNGTTDSAVTIEFAFAGEQYRAIRRRTTKGAGQSSADLQRRASGGWQPVASGDKEVPAAMRELLRMPPDTFRSSVSLAQKDLDRFVRATSGDRKEVLASIVVDPRLAPAAKAAGQRALTAERDAKADAERVDRLNDVIAELEPMRAALVSAQELVAITDRMIDEGRSKRAAADERMRVVDEQLATGAAVIGEQVRLTAERDALLASWQRSDRQLAQATAARDSASAALSNAAAIEAAAAEVADVRLEVDRLSTGEAEDRKLAAEIVTAQRAYEEVDRPIREAVTTWRTKRGLEEARIRELVEHARAGTSTCATCGQAINEASALEQLRAARARFAELGDEPRAPLELARRSAALSRLETRRRELAWDPAAIVAARDRLTGLERLAAKAEGLEAARATVAREAAAIADLEEERARIQTRGKEVASRLDEVNAQAAAANALRIERKGLEQAIAIADDAIAVGERQRRDAEARVARAEASIERLEQVTAERDELHKSLKNLHVRVGRLRKLAVAFGLKGIPAQMIERVLPELGRHANEVLSSLFGLSLEIRAQRAAADGKSTIEALDLEVREEEAGEIEQARLSGGQETAVALALAIALSRLNARRAGTAIRTLVIDEPDGLDATHLRALGEALKTLAHAGELERIFLITHTEVLAEFADLVVELRPGPDGTELFIDGIRSQPDQQAAAAA
jgi:exonuclease SbcC